MEEGMLERRIEGWKKSFLDMGKRNRLLNYRDTKRSNIRIITPDLEELYKKLVLEEREFSFPFSYFYEEDDEEETNEKVIPGDITTNRSIGEQQKTLKSLRDKARTAIEEQGVNILYVAFGFLNWTESPDSKWELVSPLILVPVTLSIESLTSPYVLKIHEDEIVINPTLVYKLENDFGICLPEFDSHESDIAEYLDSIQNSISVNGWSIKQECGLSLFSFLKMNMYSDLEAHSEKIQNNPILKALAGDLSEIKNVPEEFNDYDHDKNEKSINIFQVVDADSSQQDAILYSKQGISFVLQGPPGTGKSQTITNIIAEALADGKKVLFVSEKMAALEVVHKRLSQSDLSDFCLMLHSYKVSKKEILNELNKTLNIDRIKMQEDALYQLDSLERKRNQLNEYAKQLHEICKPLNKSIYDITGRLSKLQNVPDIIFDIDNVNDFDMAKLHETRYQIEEYSKTLGKMSGDYQKNPWKGICIDSVSHVERQNLERKLSDLYLEVTELEQHSSEAIKRNEIGAEVTYRNIELLSKLFETISTCPGVPTDWLLCEDMNLLTEKAKEYGKLNEEYHDAYEYVESVCSSGAFSLSAEKIKEDIGGTWNELQNYYNNVDRNIFINNRESEKDEIQSFQMQLEQMIVDVNHLQHIGFKVDFTEESVSEIIGQLSYFENEIYPTEQWFDEWKRKNGEALLNQYEEYLVECNTLRKRILDSYEKGIFDIRYDDILKRFKTDYASFTKIFNKDYKKDKKEILGLSRTIQKKIPDGNIVDLLNQIKTLEEKEQWLCDNRDKLQEFVGQLYQGDNTDWTSIRNQLDSIKQIISCIEVPLMLQNNLVNAVVDFKEILEVRNRIEAYKNCIGKEKRIVSKQDELMTFQTMYSKAVTIIQFIDCISRNVDTVKFYCDESIDCSKLFSVLEKIIETHKIESQMNEEEELLKKIFITEYDGLNTCWSRIKEQLLWINEYKQACQAFIITDKFINEICTDKSIRQNCGQLAQSIEVKILQLADRWPLFVYLFDKTEDLSNQKLSDVGDRIKLCATNMYLLEEWIDYSNSRKKCEEAGLKEFIIQCDKDIIPAEIMQKVYLKRFYRVWLDTVIPKHLEIANFRRRNQESLIEEFRKLDLLQMKIARTRIKTELISKLPDVNRTISASDEVAILRRELNKQRRIMPLRKLFRTIPNLLMALKPCLMMSPLSVSLFLQADSYDFDMVVFDEASQVHTEDAIGAIMRGKQVIIAGDTKQLPPTSFFAATTSDSDFDIDMNDEVEESNVFESILDEACTILPDRTLKWHYRSRNESLIAFSNAKIYNHNLITFPSPTEGEKDNGVEYVFVENGVYDRGGKKSNMQEAIKVAELVFEHIRTNPNRTLGVITFSEAQQHTVEMAIRNIRIEHSEYEYFFNEENPDAFFVKNLENVQGDERDTIIFSIGYAKDPNGVMYMNFGPLSRDGGYRRLNVAITRAKYNIKLVGSIRPTDIRVERTHSEGVKMLRSYIEFAIQGQKALDAEVNVSNVVNVDSPFEESVYDFLIKNGYDVATQVGCSGYRIDMAVKHPTLSGRFILGVECDGATYHSSRTARERDRLRQTILEDIGWKIYRIWSTDWIKDPQNEGDRLIAAVQKSLKNFIDDTEIEKAEIREVQEEIINYEIPVETIEISQNDMSHLIPEYVEADIWSVDRDYNDNTYLKSVINYVVQIESPIHFELLCKRVAPLMGNQKATVKVRNGVEYILSRFSTGVIKKGDFCWEKESKLPQVRKPNAINNRPIQHIAKEEIIEAMKLVLNNAYGISQEDLFVAVARIFGFGRTGGNIQVALKEAFDVMISDNIITILDGKVAMIEYFA
ncbi:MAG: DUF3320 domain-containing protein [Lachnospiraceae bacterium]